MLLRLLPSLRPRAAWVRRCGWAMGVTLGMTVGVVQAAPAIYTCVDAKGKRLTSDRPIAECLDREQKVLNKDGSHRLTVPPRKNAEERAAEEERRHQAELIEAARKDAIRRDRNLVMRYPDKAAHDKARESVLEDLRRSVNASERHLKTLEEERKPLIAETEFYKNKRLPPKLTSRLEANEAQQKAQRDIIQTQKTEMQRVGALYDAELAHLKKLWGGALPGSLSPETAGPPRAGIKPGS
jgi:Domain of unknown function (DUF4124)